MNGRFTKDRIDRPFRRWCNKFGTALAEHLKVRSSDLSGNYALPMHNARQLMNSAFRAGFEAGKRSSSQPGAEKL